MSEQNRQLIKHCIEFYDKRGWDWSYAVEFLLRELRKKK
jgi:hypothetical protein